MMIDQDLSIRPAGEDDIASIADILSENALPFDDLIQSNVELIIASNQGVIVGCAGIQRYGPDVLLRSVAVKKSEQKKGIGLALFEHIVSIAKSTGVERIHLLTETAQTYWTRKGFVQVDRHQAPEDIKSSTEFSHVCPSTAVYMTVCLEAVVL